MNLQSCSYLILFCFLLSLFADLINMNERNAISEEHPNITAAIECIKK